FGRFFSPLLLFQNVLEYVIYQWQPQPIEYRWFCFIFACPISMIKGWESWSFLFLALSGFQWLLHLLLCPLCCQHQHVTGTDGVKFEINFPWGCADHV